MATLGSRRNQDGLADVHSYPRPTDHNILQSVLVGHQDLAILQLLCCGNEGW